MFAQLSVLNEKNHVVVEMCHMDELHLLFLSNSQHKQG